MSRKKQKRKDITQLGLSALIVILIIYISQTAFFRIDLTEEKRYTLAGPTKEILGDLEDIVFIRIYLKGDLNIPFENFRKNIQETLDEFRVYAGENLQYEFVNPFEELTQREQNERLTELYDKGLQPTNIHSRDKEGGISEKIIIPGALIVYKNIEVPVNLLKNNPGYSAEQNINNSIESLEYEFISVINTLSGEKTDKIAFVEGHGELNEMQTGDITRGLANFYQVDRGQINGKPGILDEYKAVIIARPTEKFSEQDKYVIDQYIMRGGKVLWFIDPVNAHPDSLALGTTVALPYQLNISDQLFRYGIRLNADLLQDINCSVIPVNTAMPGNPPKFVPAPWLYYPLLEPSDNHPVTKNLSRVKSAFVSSIDTIEARGKVKKTVLLRTSASTKKVSLPAMISLQEIQNSPDPASFDNPYQSAAVLLEGIFDSNFRNRDPGQYIDDETVDFMESSSFNRMLVVSDGDIIRNDVQQTAEGTRIFELGYDRFTRRNYANKDFVVNAVNYLTDQQGIIQLRSREFRLRLLDKTKIMKQRLTWQIINVAGPALLIIIIGVMFNLYRQRKYAAKLKS